MKSLRVQFFSFLAVLLIVLLLMLNIFPITSSRDTVFQEKESSISGQAAILAASLAKLDEPDQASVGEVLRLLNISGFERTVVVDTRGQTLYYTYGTSAPESEEKDLNTALSGKTVFRSKYDGDSFLSSYAIPISRQGAISGALYLQERDEMRAVELYRQSAERGYATAICDLGLCYENGSGVKPDPVEAIQWYRKAAQQDHADARARLERYNRESGSPEK